MRPRNDDPAPIPAAVDAVLAEIMENGVTDEELKRAKRSLKAAAVYARDSGEGLANIFGAALVTGRTVRDVIEWPDRIEAVTNADIIAAARAVFVARQSVTGLLLPEREAAPPAPAKEHP